MNTTIKATRHQLSDAERTLVSEKLQPLSKYLGKNSENAELSVEIAITPDGEKHGEAFRAEANLAAGGELYRAEAMAGTLAGALDVVREDIERSLRSSKGRTRELIKRGGRAFKSMLRFGR